MNSRTQAAIGSASIMLSIAGLQHRESKHLALAVGRQVGQSGNSHAVREPSINGRLDEVGREEGERDCHVDLPLGAT
jgi:hypothetical protein